MYDDMNSAVFKDTDPELYDKLQRLKDGLAIDEHNLTDALTRQPVLFLEAREMAVHLGGIKDRRKRDREETEMRTYTSARTEMEAAKTRVTEAMLAAHVACDAKVIECKDNERSSALAQGLFSAIAEAYSQRAYMLRELTAIHGSFQSTEEARAPAAELRAAQPPSTRQRLG